MPTTCGRRSLDVNAIRMEALSQAFEAAGGKKVLIMTGEFPFMVIGKILQVKSDYVFIDVETTHIDPLEGRIIRTHLDRVISFYIEKPNCLIPVIETGCGCGAKRGDD